MLLESKQSMSKSERSNFMLIYDTYNGEQEARAAAERQVSDLDKNATSTALKRRLRRPRAHVRSCVSSHMTWWVTFHIILLVVSIFIGGLLLG